MVYVLVVLVLDYKVLLVSQCVFIVSGASIKTTDSNIVIRYLVDLKYGTPVLDPW